MTQSERLGNMQPGIPQEIEGTPLRRFNEMLERRQEEGLFICFGLDPDLKRYGEYFELPEMDTDDPNGELSDFLYVRGMEYVEATSEFAAVYKPNAGFYEQYGLAGVGALHNIVNDIKEDHPEIPVIGDVKRGDIGNTQEAYARAAFKDYGFDAATVNGYIGEDAVKPFTDYEEKGTYVLVRTSNPSAAETQNRIMDDGKPYWKHIAELVAKKWNEKGNVSIVIGATNPQELSEVREIVGPKMQILAPGVGTQGGSVKDVVAAGNDRFVINVSRSHLYPKLQEGETLQDAIKRVSQDLHDEITEERAKLEA